MQKPVYHMYVHFKSEA